MNKPLPPFKRATPNKLKAEGKKTPKKDATRQEGLRMLKAQALETKVLVARSKVLEVIADQHGKANWSELRKLACSNQRVLGLAVKSLMDKKILTGPIKVYPGWESTALYRLVVVKARQKVA